MRLIDAEALEESIEQIDWYHLTRNGEMAKGAAENGWYKEQDIYNAIEEAPTIEAKPVMHGRWVTHSDRPDSLICSVCNCGFDMWKHDPHNYCPNCGVQMDEEIEI